MVGEFWLGLVDVRVKFLGGIERGGEIVEREEFVIDAASCEEESLGFKE